MLMNRLQFYIFKQCLSSLLLTTSVILAAILLVDVVEQFRTVGGDADISFLTAMQLSFMKMPMLIEQAMPFIMLVTAMLAFSRLSRLTELPAMRAAGLSAWRFLTPLIITALVLGIFSITVLNPFGASMNDNFEQERARITGKAQSTVAPGRNGIWLRQGSETDQLVIHARGTKEGGIILQGVKIFEYDRVYTRNEGTSEFSFKRRIEADSAALKDGFWELTGVVENMPGQRPVRRDVLSIPTDLDPAKLLDRFASPMTIGFWKLPGFIADIRRAGLDASRYEMHYQSLLAAPILFVAMALIGAIVCLRLARLGGTGVLIAWGTFAAILLYFISEVTQSLGASGAAPKAIAAFTPSLFALFAALTAIAYMEDG
ncbi:MAG: LPS export ABC transporter permease LptG [Ponticaulis sp.]|nr:LPS export ABC transporter permease LptG [Ponticaulis sp.]